MSESHELTPFCPYYQRAVELIGSRWTGAVLRALISGSCRFSDIREAIPGLSDRMLSERLKALEAEAVVVRTVIPEMPVRVEYHLTEKGQALNGVMCAIATWAGTWLPEPEGAAATDPA